MPRRKRTNTEIAAQQVLTTLDKEIAQARRADRASVSMLLRDVERMAGLLRNAITEDTNAAQTKKR